MPIQIGICNAIGAGGNLAGGGPSPGPTPPLDTYTGAAAAYSVRLLRTAYSGSALRVRRAVAPFDEQDIGFTAGGDLDEAAIVAFGGSDVLVVSAWYDQSGQSNHATQINPGSQPQIYDGAAVITENGKPSLDFQGYNSAHEFTFSSSDFAAGFIDFFTIVRVDDFSQYGFMPVSSNTNGATYYQFGGTSGADKFFYQGAAAGTAIDIRGQQRLIEMYGDSTTGNTVIDGTNYSASVSVSAVPSGTRTYLISGWPAGNGWGLNGTMQELILYPSQRSGANRTGIETNINTYYSIY